MQSEDQHDETGRGRQRHRQRGIRSDHRHPGKKTTALGSDAALSVTLSATTGFVVLILGFAFHWQSTRAREGDLINDAYAGGSIPRSIAAAAGYGDWDLSRGRIFWLAVDVHDAWS